MKTKEELNAMKEIETGSKKLRALMEKELEQVTGGNDGSDTEGLRFSGKPVPLPEARSKKHIDGGYPNRKL